MPGVMLWGWDETNQVPRKVLVNEDGKLIIDPSEIFENDPTDDEHGKAPDSDWAYEHEHDEDAHHARYTDAEAVVATAAYYAAIAHASSHEWLGSDALKIKDNWLATMYNYVYKEWWDFTGWTEFVTFLLLT